MPILIIGNKSDLVDDKKVTTEDAKEFCNEEGDLMFYEASAKDGTNVEKAFHELAAAAMKAQEFNQAQNGGRKSVKKGLGVLAH